MSTPTGIETPDRSLPVEFALLRERMAERLATAGISLAVLHGSRARGPGHPRSDVDVGLLASDGRPLSYGEMGLLATDLSALLSHEVDVSDLATPDAIFRYEVARCARILFECRPGAFADFVAKTLVDYCDIQRFIPDLVAGVARRAQRDAAAARGATT